MNEDSKPLTQTEAVERVTAQMDGPLTMDDFTARVLEFWPSKAKDPTAGIRQGLRHDYLGRLLLFLDEQTLIPMRLAMSGVRFRVQLSRREIQMGWFLVFPAFQFMAPLDLPPEEFWLEDTSGHSIPVNPVTAKFRVKTVFGMQDREQTAFDLKGWYKKHGLRRNDSLLVTVLDWEAGRFCLEPEPTRVRRKRRDEIQAQNQALADHLFQQLEAARGESIRGKIAVPTAYMHLKDSTTYPADHWLEVLDQDPRMRWTGFEILYGDWSSPLEQMVKDLHGVPTQPPSSGQEPLSEQEIGQVYRFRAKLWYRKSLWRRIEIQGGQTLLDFDRILRAAFKHGSDHMSGFWKLVRRGESRRFREVDLGSINPFGEGEAADLQIASLELAPGDSLKYVFDFGDWIEHRLDLEAIDEPEAEASYPRITGQNKPRYRDCDICKDEGRKTVGTWFCRACSNYEQRAILLCDTCMETHDEDHYTEKMLY